MSTCALRALHALSPPTAARYALDTTHMKAAMALRSLLHVFAGTNFSGYHDSLI